MSFLKPGMGSRLANARRLPLSFLVALTLVLPIVALAGNFTAGSGGGFRIVSVRPSSKSSAPTAVHEARRALLAGAATTPLEGPIITVAITVTDQRSGLLDWYATAHAGVDGFPLPGATTNVVFGLLDSGSETHLVSYPDAVGVGLQDLMLTANTVTVGGVDGVQVDLDISQPAGFFVEGLQDLDAGGHPQPSLMFGQGNFAGGVNTPGNYAAGTNTPTLIGAPFLFFFPAYIRNSQPIQSPALGNQRSSPAVTFYGDAADPQIPVLTHKIFMETRPTGLAAVTYIAMDGENPDTPSTILLGNLSGALFFTASSMSFREGTNTSSGKMMVDTGAQATLLSEIAAAELNLDLQNPDFEVEVQGLAHTVIAPGFYIDSASIPALGGAVSWGNIPVIILNVDSSEGGTLYGIFGSNLTATRDLVFNGAASTPYLGVTDPIVPPLVRITAIRPTGLNSAEIDWHAEPAPAVLYLEMCTDLGLNPPEWNRVATNSLGTMNGTMSVTGLVSRQFFRLEAVQ